MKRYSLSDSVPCHECLDCPACQTRATNPPRSWCCEKSLAAPKEVNAFDLAPLWCPVAECMEPSPTGEWFHERDKMWAKVLVVGPAVRPWIQYCRADVLLSLSRAFAAWGGE